MSTHVQNDKYTQRSRPNEVLEGQNQPMTLKQPNLHCLHEAHLWGKLSCQRDPPPPTQWADQRTKRQLRKVTLPLSRSRPAAQGVGGGRRGAATAPPDTFPLFPRGHWHSIAPVCSLSEQHGTVCDRFNRPYVVEIKLPVQRGETAVHNNHLSLSLSLALSVFHTYSLCLSRSQIYIENKQYDPTKSECPLGIHTAGYIQEIWTKKI